MGFGLTPTATAPMSRRTKILRKHLRALQRYGPNPAVRKRKLRLIRKVEEACLLDGGGALHPTTLTIRYVEELIRQEIQKMVGAQGLVRAVANRVLQHLIETKMAKEGRIRLVQDSVWLDVCLANNERGSTWASFYVGME